MTFNELWKNIWGKCWNLEIWTETEVCIKKLYCVAAIFIFENQQAENSIATDVLGSSLQWYVLQTVALSYNCQVAWPPVFWFNYLSSRATKTLKDMIQRNSKQNCRSINYHAPKSKPFCQYQELHWCRKGKCQQCFETPIKVDLLFTERENVLSIEPRADF